MTGVRSYCIIIVRTRNGNDYLIDIKVRILPGKNDATTSKTTKMSRELVTASETNTEKYRSRKIDPEDTTEKQEHLASIFRLQHSTPCSLELKILDNY
ncbi:MAG: hypothetical protein ACFFD4_34435 [Candidatus Odinarchaeota archaeon]